MLLASFVFTRNYFGTKIELHAFGQCYVKKFEFESVTVRRNHCPASTSAARALRRGPLRTL